MTSTRTTPRPLSSPLAETSRSRWIIAGLSVFVSVAVLTVIGLQPAADDTPVGTQELLKNVPTALAKLNVSLNGGAAALLILGYIAIRRGRQSIHKRCMLGAFGLSSIFLISYLLHHAQVGSVPFLGVGSIRAVYFGLLIPHILLAAGIVPLALLTLYRGWSGRLPLHKKIARYTLPLWLFVSLSGVAVYFMLYNISG